MHLTTHIHPGKLMISLLLMIVVITGVVIGFSLQANARSTQSNNVRYHSQEEWIHVENGKVYYFDDKGLLCYKQLKDAQLRFNY